MLFTFCVNLLPKSRSQCLSSMYNICQINNALQTAYKVNIELFVAMKIHDYGFLASFFICLFGIGK